MRLETAQMVAQDLVRKMAPHCERLEIAGSVRRGKPQVKDIEIVAVPKWQVSGAVLPMFDEGDSEAEHVNLLYTDWALDADIRWIKTGTDEVIDWRIKPDGKYWRGLLPSGMKLDLFLAMPENFGIIFVIRTGSAEFSRELVTYARKIGKPCEGGRLTQFGRPIPTPEEEDVFRVLGLEYVPPEKRGDWSVARAIQRETMQPSG